MLYGSYSYVITYLIFFSLDSVCNSFCPDHFCFRWIYCCIGISFIRKRLGAQTVHPFHVRIMCTQYSLYSS